MTYSLGRVESIGASGRVWVGFHAMDIADLFFRELENANRSIQISSFSTGHKSKALDRFFNILEEQLKNPPMKISIIVNDDKDNNTVTPYARKQFTKLKECNKDKFFIQYFEQKRIKNTYKILHAKITIIDGKIALIGSANLSKGALESNYEIMLKISGQAAVNLSLMLSRLSEQMRLGKT